MVLTIVTDILILIGSGIDYCDRYFNTDRQFEMFKRGKDSGYDTW